MIPEKFNKNISVTDGSTPINGAVVSLDSGITCTTGSAGGCTLVDVPVGEHIVTVSAFGFETYTETINVVDGDPLPPFVLTPE